MSYETYLAHHGIKGMRWGVRRYQNPDGTLTDAGKKRVSKKYSRLMKRAVQNVNDNSRHLYVEGYNRAVDKMNNSVIKKYNEEYDKKLGDKAEGHDYFNDKEYNEGYEKLWNNILSESVNQVMKEHLAGDRNVKKAIQLVDKYSMYSFDDDIKSNMDLINDVKRIMNGGKE